MKTYKIYQPADGTCNLNGYFSNDITGIEWACIGTIEAESLEDCFVIGNTKNESHRSISVGDIIMDGDDAYMVKGTGFAVINFNPNLIEPKQLSDKETTFLSELGYVLHTLGSDAKMLDTMMNTSQSISELREDLFERLRKVMQAYYPTQDFEHFRK